MILKLGMEHQGLGVYKICTSDEPELNVTYFKARSNFVFYMGKIFGKLLNGIRF